MFLCSANASEFEVIFSILGLMLSMIATRADELPVIKDTEAASCRLRFEVGSD